MFIILFFKRFFWYFTHCNKTWLYAGIGYTVLLIPLILAFDIPNINVFTTFLTYLCFPLFLWTLSCLMRSIESYLDEEEDLTFHLKELTDSLRD